MTAMHLCSPILAACSGVRHGFFTRIGGVSRGRYGTLNCGAGSRDDSAAVATNRNRAMQVFGLKADRLATLYQTHSATALSIEAPFAGAPPKADALVTDRPGVALGILTADCAPVLFADPGAGIIAAAHAGWQGALDGIIEQTLDQMTGLGARRARISATVGPAIGPESYEVGLEFEARFVRRSAEYGGFFRPGRRGDRRVFDLPGFVRARIAACDVPEIEVLGRDTLAEQALFFSYRRNCLRGIDDYGRQLSAIVLKHGP